jgi:hypothetical protein
MADTNPPQEFQKLCALNGLPLSDAQIRLLALFVSGLLEWNSKINLISRRDQENVWFSHVLHSLALLFYIELLRASTFSILEPGVVSPGSPLQLPDRISIWSCWIQ